MHDTTPDRPELRVVGDDGAPADPAWISMVNARADRVAAQLVAAGPIRTVTEIATLVSHAYTIGFSDGYGDCLATVSDGTSGHSVRADLR